VNDYSSSLGTSPANLATFLMNSLFVFSDNIVIVPVCDKSLERVLKLFWMSATGRSGGRS